MKTKVIKKSTGTVKKAADEAPGTLDPFAEIVTEPAPKRRAAQAVKVEAKEVKKPAKRAVKKSPEPTIVTAADAFAETVNEPATLKKRSVGTSKAVAARSEQTVPAVATTEKSKKVSARKTSKAALGLSEPLAAVSPAKPKAKKVSKSPVGKAVRAKKSSLDVTAEIAAGEPEVVLSPVFKALADVTLPELQKENRARLLMQSPTRLYFYWSVRQNPWQQLRSIFGDDLGSYTLALKLTDLKRDSEQIHPCDAEGNWWFDVEPDGEYQAEIGFYAVNRPYFRVIYSNTIATPRRSPSPRPASEARWTVSANKFAEVLDVAGFSRDAFDVAMAGDDPAAAQDTAHMAFTSFIGESDYKLDGISSEDIRYAMLALASGFTLEELRWRVSPALFAILQAHVEKLAADKAQTALGEYFDIDETEWTEEEFSAAVYGASLVHFPRTLKTMKSSSKGRPALSPRYNPVSSHSLR